ncbi:universal stress protein [Dyadobacter sandarakinus]|uniref:Universal stress protein n=1 Tax=Dyadobacter sandarakinus TaxID=2747268 RepID=A0ABX7I6N7_9BACT|nr:universal stress protein [Dyadobacter sandarakinus]QRR01771.1 universal stress protein [Dyadobacter sandarakinus]
MNRILIPIDFSENAVHALAAAKILAEPGQTELLVLHAYEPYIADVNVRPGNMMPGIATPDFLSLTNDLEDEFKKKLEQYTAELRAEGYQAEALWVLGSLQSAVEDAAAEYKPNMIIIGRTGTGGFLDKLIGTSATQLAMHSACPVMVIPPQATPRKFLNVVYATQFEYDETDILKEVYVLMNYLGARLTLLKVQAEHQPNIQPDNQYINEIKSEFAITDADIVVRTAKHALDGIEDYCDETRADLLIMSARERSFIEEFLINPSVTKKLIVDTHIPLLVFHLK